MASRFTFLMHIVAGKGRKIKAAVVLAISSLSWWFLISCFSADKDIPMRAWQVGIYYFSVRRRSFSSVRHLSSMDILKGWLW